LKTVDPRTLKAQGNEMRYLPHTAAEVAEMLQAIGRNSLDELFATIPADSRFKGRFQLPEPLTEWELNASLAALARNMASADRNRVFIGAGSYQHYSPEIVRYLINRSEFSTAYTPYQPEISQGTLQGIFEYQTLVARLLGLEVANASLYDGASALAEALLMAIRITKRPRVLMSSRIHPLYRKVVDTYLRPTGFEVATIPGQADGRTDLSGLEDLETVAAIAVQSPNFLGVIEDLTAIGRKTEDSRTLFVCCFTEPLAYGLLKSPGLCGADIACGEGQSFGIPPSFGGPGLGMFACKAQYVRSMPGRLVGQTTDSEGRRGFVLTLATREQHIRREKATSNICSNQGLCALTAAIYLAALGGTGLRELAQLNFDQSEYLKRELKKGGCVLPYDGPTFNEFVVRFPPGFAQTWKRLASQGILAGLALAPYDPAQKDDYLLCVTETVSKNDLDELVREVCR